MSYRDDWFANNESNHGWYTCAKCGKKIRKADADIDHIVPQKYGGSDKLFNLQCLCKHCNRSKQANMKDTVPDLLKTNHQRAVKAVKKNLQGTRERVVESVKTAAKSAVKKVLGESKTPSTTKKASTTQKVTTAKKASTTQKVTTAKKASTTQKVTTTKKVSETKSSTAKKTSTSKKK